MITGDSLVVWDAPGGRVHVALRTAGSARFGPARALSGPGVDASTISAAHGHDGEAVIAWSAAGRTFAAMDIPGKAPGAD
jgi:hypothetical protein